jgi:predicted site-specific integrase-resolvase
MAIVNSQELAKRYRVSPATVLAWARRGWIPRLRAGRHPIMFDTELVDRALRERGSR